MSDDGLSNKQLLSLISHELRTPLNSIMGFAQLIAMDADASPKIGRWADMIHASGSSLGAMIESLVTFASADGITLTSTPFDAGQLVTDAAADAAATFSPGSNPIAVEVDPDIPRVVGCERSIRRVLANLMTNAMQYGDGSAKATVTRQQVGGGSEAVALRFTVTDNGAGILPADQAQCFLPFRRGTGVSGIGLGLGLPIATRLVDALGGSIAYTNDGGPSTFTFDLTLPRLGQDGAPTT